jgi:PPOX class probable F420-dependent enzyme
MTPAERFAAARVARLATVGHDGAPHLVPIVFALVDDVIYSAVDAKPKRHGRLRRLANIAHEPRVSVLADRYDDDWTLLWWVRADGVARVLPSSAAALDALTGKYPQYRAEPPPGPFLEIQVGHWSAWSASAG